MTISDSNATYFIRVRGRILGPYDVAQLKTLRARGQFSRANEVSTDRQAWQSAGTIEHLFASPAKTDKRQEASPDSVAAPSRPAPATATRTDAAGWYYAVGTEQYGPVSLLDLRGVMAAGKITPNDLVWKDGLVDWTPFRDVPELWATIGSGTAEPVSSARATDDANERYLFFDTYALAANLRKAGLTGIFPFRAWFRDRPFTLVWVQLLVFMFSFPLLLGQYYVTRNAPLVEAAGALSLYFAIIGAAIMHRCIRPEPVGLLTVFSVWIFTGLFGVAAVILISLLGGVLPFMRDAMAAIESANFFGRLFGFTLGVGLIEEMVKAIPALWIAGRSSKSMSPNTGAFIGCVSGLAFGSTEAVTYSVSYAIGHSVSAIPSYGDYILVQILRFVSLPLLHGIWSGIAAYFIFLGKRSAGSRGLMIILGLVLVSALHGAYDTLISDPYLGWAGAAVAIISLLMFVGYIRSDASLEAGNVV